MREFWTFRSFWRKGWSISVVVELRPLGTEFWTSRLQLKITKEKERNSKVSYSILWAFQWSGDHLVLQAASLVLPLQKRCSSYCLMSEDNTFGIICEEGVVYGAGF